MTITRELIVRGFLSLFLFGLWLLPSCGGSSKRPHPDVQQDQSDTETAQPCRNDDDCDDMNPCTTDSCGADGFCQHDPDAEATCDDGNPCTVDSCSADGQCVNEIVAGRACDDSNACTDDGTCDEDGNCVDGPSIEMPHDACIICTCDPIDGVDCDTQDVGDICDDGDCCSSNDRCAACSPADEDCNDYGIRCRGVARSCDDDRQCTRDACVCDVDDQPLCTTEPLPDGAACIVDPNACNQGDTCQSGSCMPGEPLVLDDNNPCTSDRCVKGEIVHEPLNEGQCDDQEPCTTNDQCMLGACVGGPRIVCDQPPCASSVACIDGTGCVYVWKPAGSVCDDNNACTSGDHCDDAQVCVPTHVTPSDDGNDCTIDTCDQVTGQVSHTARVGACDDGDLCTYDDACQEEGLCSGTVAVTCETVTNPCLQRVCNPLSGVCDLTMPNGTPCVDSNLCNGTESCQDGLCVPGQQVVCQTTPGSCTGGSCNPATGLCDRPLPDGSACVDGSICTSDDQCENGVCVGTAVSCPNDNNACTDDVCVQETGLCGIARANGSPVPDANLCNGTETCQNGQVVAGQTIVCPNTNNACMQDTCVPATGQCGVPQPEGTACAGRYGECTEGTCVIVGYPLPEGYDWTPVGEGPLVPSPEGCGAPDFPCTPGQFDFRWPYDSGQVQCFDNTQQIGCVGTAGGANCAATGFCGQDAQYGADLETPLWSTGRFVVGGSLEAPIVEDRWTGLIWMLEYRTDLTWQSAVDYCAAVASYSGYDGWALPDDFQLSTLLNYGLDSPASDFPQMPAIRFWSAANTRDPFGAHYVSFIDGDIEPIDPALPMGARCVHVVQPIGFPSDRYFRAEPVLGQPIIFDNRTALIWVGLYDDDTNLTWQGALAYCESLNYGGLTTWRLPDVMEFRSLLDNSRQLPSIDTGAFPGTPAFPFWTSSTKVGNPSLVWTIGLLNSLVYLEPKTKVQPIRCVTGGP